MENFLKVVNVVAFLVVVVLAGFMPVWALNELFGLGIGYTWRTLLAVWLLVLFWVLVRADGRKAS